MHSRKAFPCGTETSAGTSTPTASRYSIRWKIICTTFRTGTGKTVSWHSPDSTLQQPVLGRTVPPLVSQHGGTLARQYRQEICQQRLPLIGRCTRHPQKHLLPKHRPARAACLLYGQHRLLAQARRRTLPQPFCAHQHR